MAHHDTKQPACANCHYTFVPGEPDEFCPSCGQQNHAVNIGFGHIVEEFLEGIFHFDGKVFRTAKLLLFQPGELTRRFLAGQRVPYVPPIRLYVFISFVFFFVLSLQGGHEKEGKAAKPHLVSRPAALHRLATLVDSIDDADSDTDTAGIPTAKSHIHVKIGSQTPNENLVLKGDSSWHRLPAAATDTQIDSTLKANGKQPDFWGRLVLHRYLRWRNASPEEIRHDELRGASILMFLLMPLSALLLKLVYLRRKRYYLGHLIFAIHLHCFLFVALLLNMALALLPASDFSEGLLAVVGGVYFVLALRRVYEQGWGKTLFKALLLGLSYGLLALVATLIVGALGLVLY